MNTVRKITKGCVVIVLLISVLFLMLNFRAFANKELKGYAIEKEAGLVNLSQDILSGSQQEAILTGEGGPGLPQYPFPVGEKLNYFIYSAGIKVGNAQIVYLGRQDINGVIKDVILVQANAPGFSDTDIIYGDIETFSPARVERKIKLFGEDVKIVEEYSEDTREVLITRKGKKTTTQRFISDDKISNIILLLYHFRCNKDKYKIGEKIRFNLPTQKLEMYADKNTAIKVPMGQFQAIFVKSVPSRFKIWFKDDDRVPLRIQGAIGFGNTYLDLKDVE